MKDTMVRKWWKEAVVYQLYPRSFKDSNGDGVGDLKGILEKLDYLQSLGVDVIWLNPVYGSPNDDNGYDISDYYSIMKEFGTMQDFDTLLNELHNRGIKLVMDLVVNHTSDEHEWFIQSRSSRDNPYRDYYIWWPAEKGKPAYRQSFFDEHGDAWAYDEKTDAYYFHIFSKKQPDLNWDNPLVREEIYKMMKFWFDKGVDGFRMDAITYISKDHTWPEATEIVEKNFKNDWGLYYSTGPRLHEYLREMNREVLSKYDVMTVAEAPGIPPEDAHKFVDPDRKELNMIYHFEAIVIGYLPGEFKQCDPNGYDVCELKRVYTKWSKAFSDHGWGTVYLGNHDQPRMVSRWGNDAEPYRKPSAKMLNTFLLTMHATPFLYMGDEIGMANIRFNNIEDYRDIETISKYKYFKKKGKDLDKFLESQKESARDNSRTPFQWDASSNTGFTTGQPWIKVNPDHNTYNVASEENDADSILHYFRKMIKLRKEHQALIYGDYELLDADHKQLYTYTRTLGKEKLMIILNFSKEIVSYKTPYPFEKENILINNYTSLEKGGDIIQVLPYQAIIVKL